jgi:Rhs element Vgr protein
MPKLPGMHDSPVISINVLINGKEIDDQFTVISLEVERSVNKVSKASIVIADGSSSSQDFEASQSASFQPGTEVELKAGFDMKLKTIFKGVITRHRIRSRKNAPSELQLFCSDKSIKMTLGRKSKYFEKKTDSAIISSVIQDNGLEASVGATSYQHPQLVQYYSTDWDFVIARAEVNGLILNNIDGKVTVDKPSVSSAPVLKVGYGVDIYDFDLQLDAQSQMVDVHSQAWDIEQQKMIEEKSQEPSVNAQGDINGKKLAEVLNVSVFQLQTSGFVDKAQLKNWANATLAKTRLSRIKGSIEFSGSDVVLPDTLIEIEGLGKRFNGHAYVSGVVHIIESGGWRTKAIIGLDAESFVEQHRNVSAPPASGILPGIEGLQIGTVKKIDGDPDGNTRLLVDVPVIEESGRGIWARISNFYATRNAGSFFLPEVGDEVVLGFINNDPRYAVILGMLYSQKKRAPFIPEKKNTTKAIVTNSQLKVTFEEEDRAIIIETPAGNKVTLSDKARSIELIDSNKNKVVMDQSGILLESAKDIVLKAKANVSISANAKISLDAKADVNVAGLNVTNDAKVSFKGTGKASAELSAAGQTTVKGAMVMIN